MSVRTNPNFHFILLRSSLSSNNNNNNNNNCTNFTKGSLIELATGELKRVEDMRAEDFIVSSNKNPDLQLADTTVVKISTSPLQSVVVTFVYNNVRVSFFPVSFLFFPQFEIFEKTLVESILYPIR